MAVFSQPIKQELIAHNAFRDVWGPGSNRPEAGVPVLTSTHVRETWKVTLEKECDTCEVSGLSFNGSGLKAFPQGVVLPNGSRTLGCAAWSPGAIPYPLRTVDPPKLQGSLPPANLKDQTNTESLKLWARQAFSFYMVPSLEYFVLTRWSRSFPHCSGHFSCLFSEYVIWFQKIYLGISSPLSMKEHYWLYSPTLDPVLNPRGHTEKWRSPALKQLSEGTNVWLIIMELHSGPWVAQEVFERFPQEFRSTLWNPVSKTNSVIKSSYRGWAQGFNRDRWHHGTKHLETRDNLKNGGQDD